MKNYVIALTRTCGSGATSIGKGLSEKLDLSLYDKNLLRLAADDSGINEAMFAQVDEHVKNSILYRVSKRVYNGELIPPESNDFKSSENLFNYQAKILRELVKKESFICIGRAGDYVLKDYPNLIRIFIYAPLMQRITHEAQRLNITEKEAEKRIIRMDQYRKEYYQYHTGNKWESIYNYDLCLNTGSLTYDQSIDYIVEYLLLKGFITRENINE